MVELAEVAKAWGPLARALRLPSMEVAVWHRASRTLDHAALSRLMADLSAVTGWAIRLREKPVLELPPFRADQAPWLGAEAVLPSGVSLQCQPLEGDTVNLVATWPAGTVLPHILAELWGEPVPGVQLLVRREERRGWYGAEKLTLVHEVAFHVIDEDAAAMPRLEGTSLPWGARLVAIEPQEDQP